MNTNDITVTLTEFQHELLNDVLSHALESYQLVAPYDEGMWNLPQNNPIIQRYDTLKTLREMFIELWSQRFDSNGDGIYCPNFTES